MNVIKAESTESSIAYISLPILWVMITVVIVLIAISVFYPGIQGQCAANLLAHISTLFNGIDEVRSISEDSVIGCQISLAYGLALSSAPLFGLLVNFSKIDRDPLRRIGMEESFISKCLTFTFVLLLGLAPYFFGNSVSLPHQFSYSFFQLVRSNSEVLFIFSIGVFVSLTAVWTFLFFKLFSLLGVK